MEQIPTSLYVVLWVAAIPGALLLLIVVLSIIPAVSRAIFRLLARVMGW